MSERPFNFEYHSYTNSWSKFPTMGFNLSFNPFGISLPAIQRVKKSLRDSYLVTLSLRRLSFSATCSLFLLVAGVCCNEDVICFVSSLTIVHVEAFFYQDAWRLFSTFSFWSPVVCFFSLPLFVVEEECWLAASSVPSKHYIGWTRSNGYTTSKNKLFFPTSFGSGCSQGICQIYDLQVLKDILRHFTTDVSCFGPYAETKNDGSERKVCIKWIQFRSWFRPSGAKVSNFII